MNADEINIVASLATELKTLQAAIDKNWIEASEELPPDSAVVLVFCNGYCESTDAEGRNGGAWGIRTGWYDYSDGQWYLKQNWPVTHWMPLPPPPATAQPNKSLVANC